MLSIRNAFHTVGYTQQPQTSSHRTTGNTTTTTGTSKTKHTHSQPTTTSNSTTTTSKLPSGNPGDQSDDSDEERPRHGKQLPSSHTAEILCPTPDSSVSDVSLDSPSQVQDNTLITSVSHPGIGIRKKSVLQRPVLTSSAFHRTNPSTSTRLGMKKRMQVQVPEEHVQIP